MATDLPEPQLDGPQPLSEVEPHRAHEPLDAGGGDPEGTERVKQGPQWNIYGVMLLLAFLFLCTGSVMLFVEWANYGFSINP